MVDPSAGDNFFKPATYTIEALCAKSYEDTTLKLKDIEAQILRKRNELRQFEVEYRKVVNLLLDKYLSWVIDSFVYPDCTTFHVNVHRHWHISRK